MSPTSYRAAPPRTSILSSDGTRVNRARTHCQRVPKLIGKRFVWESSGNCLRGVPCRSAYAPATIKPHALLHVRCGLVGLTFHRDPQRAQEVEVVGGELPQFAFAQFRCPGSSALFGDFVQTDRGFEHEQHIESVLADVLHHAGDLLALDDRLMDGLAQLLNQFTQTGCHSYLHERRARGIAMRVATRNLFTLLPFRVESNPGPAPSREKHRKPLLPS